MTDTEEFETETQNEKTPSKSNNVDSNVLKAIRAHFIDKNEKNVTLDIKRISPVNYRLNWWGIAQKESSIGSLVADNKIIRSKFIKVISSGSGYDFIDQTKMDSIGLKDKL